MLIKGRGRYAGCVTSSTFVIGAGRLGTCICMTDCMLGGALRYERDGKKGGRKRKKEAEGFTSSNRREGEREREIILRGNEMLNESRKRK